MKNVLTLTAVGEIATGLALLIVPSLVGQLLLGVDLSGVSIVIGRVAGVALIALGVACWLARSDRESRAARGVLTAMVLYNIGTVAVLGAAGAHSQATGIALWPAVIFHAAMTLWCLSTLLAKPPRRAE